MYLDTAKIDVLLTFIMTACNFETVLIAVDNLDESSPDVKDVGFSFSKQLSDICIDLIENDNPLVSILVPLRHYTSFGIETEGYPRIDLPDSLVSALVEVKIEHAKKMIDANLNIQFRERFDTSKKRRREIILPNGRRKTIWELAISDKWLKIDNVSTVLKLFSQKARLLDKNGFMDFLNKISGENYKLLTKNVYNMFHSCKLNITDVIHFVFLSEETEEYRNLMKRLESRSFGVPLIYDLGMAIHYPFYDVEQSCIPNILNVNSYDNPNDYRNTFGIVRIMCYLKNNGEISKTNLFIAMNSIGYENEYINKAMDKMFKYCLVKTEHGVTLDDLNPDSLIEMSTSGEYMLDWSLCDERYLTYVCEDVPMEDDYKVDIAHKCWKRKSETNIEKRHEAVDKFLLFLEKEENNEIQWVTENKGFKKESFLRDFSLKSNGQYDLVVNHMKKRISLQQ